MTWAFPFSAVSRDPICLSAALFALRGAALQHRRASSCFLVQLYIASDVTGRGIYLHPPAYSLTAMWLVRDSYASEYTSINRKKQQSSRIHVFFQDILITLVSAGITNIGKALQASPHACASLPQRFRRVGAAAASPKKQRFARCDPRKRAPARCRASCSAARCPRPPPRPRPQAQPRPLRPFLLAAAGRQT